MPLALEGSVEVQILEMLERRVPVPRIVIHLKGVATLAQVRAVKADAYPETAVAVTNAGGFGHRRADRFTCGHCGGLQSEHLGGVGASSRTFCHKFIEVQAEEQDSEQAVAE